MKKDIIWGSIPIIGLETNEDLNKYPISQLAKIENGSNIGKRKRTLEEIEKIRENSKKLRHTDETKEICRQKSIGLNIGRKHTQEAKNKISNLKKGTKASEETKNKMSESSKKRTNHFNEKAIKNRLETNCRPVLYYSYPDMKFICEFKSATEASRQLNKNRGGILKILNGTIKEPRNFTFKYKN